ncbi:MAG: isoleucine--tRNA ligase [Coriobacteriales bacterium]|nr:isoleucine--tRNA ligase [Coriobacteriales bacterium]
MPQDYKDTMNLPQTDFPMRGNLPVNEPLRMARWDELDLYQKMLERNEGNASYVLHDGPPYANGPIHVGHVLNKVLKDIIVKYKSLRGFYAPYVPGWDCHGQPIEHMVESMLGPEKMAATSQPELRRLCRAWAEKYVGIQAEGFRRLGVLGAWDDPYLTYTPSYEAGNVEVFSKLYASGAVYRGRKPIHWCCHCHTALAEAEIEYADKTSSSVYVAFRMIDEVEGLVGTGAENDAPAGTHVLIWTTTPWTLPANSGVTVLSDADYVCLLTDDKALIIAYELVDSVAKALAIESPRLRAGADGAPLKVSGSDLYGLLYQQPVHEGMTGRIVVGPHVELTTGTGAVHTAPGHGQEDYHMGIQHDLPLLMPVDGNGVFDAGAGPFAHQSIWEADQAIIEWLRAAGLLMASEKITHSYPHCWRCHEPLIFRATDQWFVSMDATGLREKALEATGQLTWYPAWAVNRLHSMVEQRPDWCISRQRSWGVPLPVFKCSQCSATVATPETFDAVKALFEHEGSDAWFVRNPSEYLPEGTSCATCGCTELVPERDILDVWWESGVSHTSVLRKRDYLGFPADLYLEGSDQHRGWFQSSLLTSVGAYGTAPFRGIMSCGFVTDGDGNKQSKSRGNVIDPADIIARFGADVLRLWVGSVDSSQDVGIDEEIIQRTSEAYRRIRNTLRFLLSNLYDFDPVADTVSFERLAPLDRWALVRIQDLTCAVTEAYDAMRFHVAFHAVYDYLATDLSAVYLDVLKDRLYSDAPKSAGRRAAQTVLASILESLVRSLAPILTFTCDEAWEHYPAGMRAEGRAPSVLLAGWPGHAELGPAVPADAAEALRAQFATVLGVRDLVTKALEDARATKLVGKSQEARVVVTAPHDVCSVLEELGSAALEELLIVATVTVASDDTLAEPQVMIERAAGEKCPRCWNIRTLGVDKSHPELCGRCAEVVSEAFATKVASRELG